jgi:hypothetical protein
LKSLLGRPRFDLGAIFFSDLEALGCKDRFGLRRQDLVNHSGHSTTSCGFELAPTTKSANLPLAIQLEGAAWTSGKTK